MMLSVWCIMRVYFTDAYDKLMYSMLDCTANMLGVTGNHAKNEEAFNNIHGILF